MAELQTHNWTFASCGIHPDDVTGVKSFRGWKLLAASASDDEGNQDGARSFFVPVRESNSRNSSVFPSTRS